MKEKVRKALEEYFDIGDSYTYELTRVKEALSVGTVTLDDFVEWGEEEVNNLCNYLCDKLQEQNKWHYCKDELPPKRQDILVVLRDGDMSTGYLSDEYFYVDCMSKKYVEIKNVIAWRELPKFEGVW